MIITCPLCKSANSSEPFERCSAYVRCKECGLVWTPELPAPNYEEDYYFFDPKHDRQQRKRAEFFLNIVRNELSSSGLHLLDIGCGSGHFASLCSQHGWKVVGADISHLAIQICRERRTVSSSSFPMLTI